MNTKIKTETETKPTADIKIEKANYNIIADLHTHTTASTHAYGTINENLENAKRKGLKILAITNHGPALPDSPHPWHFYNLRVLPKEVDGIILLKGIEANITDTIGSIDLEDEYLKNLDWVIASFHKQTFKVSNPKIHTEGLIGAANNTCVDLIGHPDAPEYPFDIREVVKACKDNEKFIEMNNSSFLVRKGGAEKCRQIALECMNFGVSIVVNSDAHCSWDVGKFSTILEMLEEISFPQELIFNSDEKRVLEYIKRKVN